MNYRISLPLLLTLALLFCPVLSMASEPIIVFASVSPQKQFLSAIGGSKINVKALVGPSHSPATYEPSPKQMTSLAKATIYFSIGAPFESVWLDRIKKINPNLRVVDMRDGLNMLKLSEHDHGVGHGHDDLDPHIWTSPVNVIKICNTIEKTLSKVDRKNAHFYSKNLELYATRLQALHSTIKEKLAKHTGASFMVYHPSWGYYAREYGLHQIAIESMGKEPGAATLTKLINFGRDEGVSVIFTQKQFSDRAARTLAKSIGAKVVELDPMANDYFENIVKVTDAISGALK